MSFSVESVSSNPVTYSQADLRMQEAGQLNGRVVTPMPSSYSKQKTAGGGIGCCGLGILFLIAGGITLGVCPEAQSDQGCTEATVRAGKALLITGGSLVGASLCCVCTVLGIFACFAE